MCAYKKNRDGPKLKITMSDVIYMPYLLINIFSMINLMGVGYVMTTENELFCITKDMKN